MGGRKKKPAAASPPRNENEKEAEAEAELLFPEKLFASWRRFFSFFIFAASSAIESKQRKIYGCKNSEFVFVKRE